VEPRRLNIRKVIIDTWFFAYMSTAVLIGVMILFMLLYSFSNQLPGHVAIVMGWVLSIVSTLPYRKAMAISIDYIIEKYSEEVEESGNRSCVDRVCGTSAIIWYC
jgi:hypothetical protein